MLKKIESLRKQPVEVRNRYAFWIAACVTLVIAIIWGSTLPARFVEEEVVAEEVEESSIVLDSVRALITSTREKFGPVVATQEEATTTEERIDLVELVKNATTTPEERPLPPQPSATSTAATTSTTTSSSTSQSN